MRNIKFRTWYDKEQKMVYDPVINGKTGEVFETIYGEIVATVPYLPVMQSTGLQTENVKLRETVDVYEGDIFREIVEDFKGDTYIYHVVMWISQRAAFYLVPVEHLPILRDNNCEKDKSFEWLFQEAALYDFSLDIDLPLVGNMYENPELLKK